MEDTDRVQGISLAVVYVDQHLIELDAHVTYGNWGGRVRAYSTSRNVELFTKALDDFIGESATSAEFTAGADTGIGLIALRFYRIDKAGHIACHVLLAKGKLPTEHRPEEVFRLSIEVRVDAWALIQFAQQLAELARLGAGDARLPVVLCEETSDNSI